MGNEITMRVSGPLIRCKFICLRELDQVLPLSVRTPTVTSLIAMLIACGTCVSTCSTCVSICGTCVSILPGLFPLKGGLSLKHKRVFKEHNNLQAEDAALRKVQQVLVRLHKHQLCGTENVHPLS